MVLHLLVKDKRCNTIVLFEANNFVLHLLVHYCLSGGSPPQRHQTSGLFSKKTEGNGIVFHILVQYSLSIEYWTTGQTLSISFVLWFSILCPRGGVAFVQGVALRDAIYISLGFTLNPKPWKKGKNMYINTCALGSRTAGAGKRKEPCSCTREPYFKRNRGLIYTQKRPIFTHKGALLNTQKRRILHTKGPYFTRKRGVFYTQRGLVLHTKEAYFVCKRALFIDIWYR